MQCASVNRRHRQTFWRIKGGRSDANIRFADLLSLLRHLGFELRVRGSHHVLWKDGLDEILNFQPRGTQAKPYQVKQVRALLIKYRIGWDDE
jgi:hypothetical protein